MISSVVPGLNFTLMRMVQTYFHKTPAFVSSQLNCGIDISYSPVSALGADRIANATAAYAAYGGPVITVGLWHRHYLWSGERKRMLCGRRHCAGDPDLGRRAH